MEQVMNMVLFFVFINSKKGDRNRAKEKTEKFYSVQIFSTKNARVAHCGNYVKVIVQEKKVTDLRTSRDLSNNRSSRNYFGRYTGVRYAM